MKILEQCLAKQGVYKNALGFTGIQNGWIYATDTFIMVRRPLREGEQKAEDQTTPEGKYPNAEKTFNSQYIDQPGTEFPCSQFEGLHFCEKCEGKGEWTAEGECDLCSGSGEHRCPDCDSYHECGECDGSGKADRFFTCAVCDGDGVFLHDKRTKAVDLGGVRISSKHAMIIMQLPDPRYSLPDDREVAISFRGGEYQGLVSPFAETGA